MKRIIVSLLFLSAGYIGANAQNTFPSTGRTGIYTNTPAASLQVKGGARMGTLTNYTNIDSATGNLSFVGNALYQVGNNKFAFQSASQPLAGLFFNATNLRYEFRNTAGVSVLNLGAGASNNFLGIGNTTPITQLANTSSNIVGSDFNGVSPNSIAWATNADGFAVATYNANTGVKGNGLAVKIAGNSGRLLDLSVGASQTVAGTSVMVVNGNGNVGIGTQGPANKLSVNGNADVSGYVGIGPGIPTAPLQIANAATGGNKRIVMYQDVDNDNEFYGFGINANQIRYQVDALVSDHVFFAGTSPTTSNELMRIKGTGLIGIGTSSPAAKLDIAGNIKITDGTEGAGKILTSDANGLASWTVAPAASPFTISGNDIFNSNIGNIGIGTATPAAKLEVNGDALINGVTIGKGTGGVNDNTAIGNAALYYNTTGSGNTANGYQALYSTTTGYRNTANGYQALYSNTTGMMNTTSGWSSLYRNTTGYYNTANGFVALYSNTTGYQNCAYGYATLDENTTGYKNTAFGSEALQLNTDGYNNTAIGYQVLYNDYSGTYNTGIGSGAGEVSRFSLTNATVIGANATVDASNKVRIGNTDVTSIGGQVGWTTFSDGRYKQNIKKDVHGLDFINSLNPVTYTVDIKGLDNYFDKNRKKDSLYDKMKKDMQPSAGAASKIVYNGFVAQEVEAAAKKLNYDFSGVDKPQTKDGLYGLRYSDFVVPLVKAVQELSKQNDDLKSENEELKNIVAKQQEQINGILEKLNTNQSTVSANCNAVVLSDMASLDQNAPNPFSTSTVIKFSLPKQYTNAQIIITDMNGHTIKQANVTGLNALNVSAGSLSAGTYKYALVVDGKVLNTKTMILTR